MAHCPKARVVDKSQAEVRSQERLWVSHIGSKGSSTGAISYCLQMCVIRQLQSTAELELTRDRCLAVGIPSSHFTAEINAHHQSLLYGLKCETKKIIDIGKLAINM